MSETKLSRLTKIRDTLLQSRPCTGRCKDGKVDTPETVWRMRFIALATRTRIEEHDSKQVREWKEHEFREKVKRIPEKWVAENTAEFLADGCRNPGLIPVTNTQVNCPICSGTGKIRVQIDQLEFQHQLRAIVDILIEEEANG